MASYSERLADFAVNLKYESIPSKIVSKAKLHLLDSIGVAFASRTEPFAKSLGEASKSLAGLQQSTVFGTKDPASCENAVLVNGALVHGIDYDDTHIPAIIHPSAVVIPTVLACGEAGKISGKKALEAIILGYEIIIRLGLAAGGKFHDRGFHATPLCGTFAACVVAGKIRGGTSRQMVNAMGICGSQGGGIQQFLTDGTWIKKLHPGWAAHSGVIADLLASQGFTGPSEVFEGQLGFYAAYLGLENCRLNLISEGLGEVWETLRISIKPYPSCHFTHSFIDCVLDLKKEHKIDWQDVKNVNCRISPRGALIVCEPIEKRRKVTTPYGGRFSLPYTVAVALVEGRVGMEQFYDRYLSDPRITATAALVDFTKDEKLSKEVSHFPGDVTIEMKNGKRYHRLQPYERGSIENPLPENEIKQKFEANLAEAGISDKNRVEKIIQTIDQLEKAESLDKLTALLR
jgi:2-methylcitrate dehydratase PrpD